MHNFSQLLLQRAFHSFGNKIVMICVCLFGHLDALVCRKKGKNPAFLKKESHLDVKFMNRKSRKNRKVRYKAKTSITYALCL